ncbi:MAG: HAD family hydrolase [Candidatus Hodarchaeales archaeon]
MTQNNNDKARNILFLFDLDGTLLNTVDYHLTAYNNAFKKYFRIDSLKASAITPFFGLPLKNVLTGIFKATGIKLNEENFEIARNGYLEQLKRTLDSLTRNDVFPGVFELLKELHEKNMAMAIITGNPRITGNVIIEKTGLSRYFPDEMRFFSHESRVADRRDLIFRAREKYRAAVLDTDPFTVVIGDTPHDIKAGNETGCLTAAVCFRNRFYSCDELIKVGADYIISNPAGFSGLLNVLLNKTVEWQSS